MSDETVSGQRRHSPPQRDAPRAGSMVAVDIGNSFTHCRAYRSPTDSEPLPVGVSALLTLSRCAGEAAADSDRAVGEQLAKWIPQSDLAAPANWMIASVNEPSRVGLCGWLAKHRPDDRVEILSRNDFELEVAVDHPELTGLDRLAAAVSANRLRAAHRPAIIIDSGSAITVDLVSANGTFQGGAILPGLQMGARALAQNTDQLPEIRIAELAPSPIGKNTQDAIQAGLFWGLLGGIRELVTQISREHSPPPQLFLTGGGAVWQMILAEHEGARSEPELVLQGIALAGLRRMGARG